MSSEKTFEYLNLTKLLKQIRASHRAAKDQSGSRRTARARHWVALVLACNVYAQSQPPSPAPTKFTQNDKSKTARKQTVASGDKSDADSVSAQIDQLKSKLATWENRQAAKQRQENTSSDWWLRWSTIATAIATLAIAGLGIFQGWAMHKQRLAMDAQAAYMRDGLAETKKAADASVASAETARRTFVDSHQPKLAVRFMFLNGSREQGRDIIMEGRLFVHNVGLSVAILTSQYTEIFIGNHLPAINPYEGKIGEQLIDVTLEPGRSTVITFPTVKPEGSLQHHRQWVHYAGRTGVHGGPNASDLFVIGWIKYNDSMGRERTFGFSRKFDWLTQRFNRTPDQDYEYDD